MPKVDKFSAPGNLADFDGAMADGWSDLISGRFDTEVTNLAQQNTGISSQFYNPTRLDVTATPVPISWPAFPNIVEIQYGDDPRTMFQAGESRDNQDEYLEWAVTRADGKISRIMLTCEGPEYWKFIAGRDRALLAKLYSDIVGRNVPLTDLLTPAGAYRPRNPWNLAYAIHLIQGANTLAAEINIAAQATVIRSHDGHSPITAADDLITCSGYGNPERHSDPHIGDIVNEQARKGCSVTLQDPVGLYIEKLIDPKTLKIKTPNGTFAGTDYWTLVRGDNDHILRAVFEVPAGELHQGQPFVVGDLTIEGDPIEFGGQLVKAGLRMKLHGMIGNPGVFHNGPFPCPGEVFSAFAGAPHSRNG